MRSRVMLMVALLATAGIMATMAYTSAEVRNPAQATIVRTDVALLALDCNEGVGYMDESCTVEEDGRLHLNFAKGLGGESSGGDSEPGEITHGQPYTIGQLWYVDVSLGGETKEVFLTNRWGDEIKRVRIKDLDQDGYCYTIEWEYSEWESGNERWKWDDGQDRQGCFDEPEPGTEPAPGLYGFQPGSTYVFNNLVKVTNNSEDTIEIDYDTEGDLFNNGESNLDIVITLSETTLGPGEFAYISFEFDVPDDWSDQTGNEFPNGDEQYPFDGTLTVTAIAVAAE